MPVSLTARMISLCKQGTPTTHEYRLHSLSSNCVVNLAHDKYSVLKGAYDALKVCSNLATANQTARVNRMVANSISAMCMLIDKYQMS